MYYHVFPRDLPFAIEHKKTFFEDLYLQNGVGGNHRVTNDQIPLNEVLFGARLITFPVNSTAAMIVVGHRVKSLAIA